MIWTLSDSQAPAARAIADRHYNRHHVGAPRFAPPGRVVVLAHPRALWVTIWQEPQYVHHAWPDAWLCTTFRNEGAGLSSELIRQAVAGTRSIFGPAPAEGLVTFVDERKVRAKADPGYCFLRAGFHIVGKTSDLGLIVLQLLEADMPVAEMPLGQTYSLALA